MSSSSYDFKLIRHKTNINMKPFLLLKDYLRDDFSSCSSNGFKSFPRSSSTSVRFLLDLDLHTTSFSSNHHHLTKKNTKRRSISILLQRASGVLLSVVKLLPFTSSSSTSSSLSTTTSSISSSNNKSSSSSSSGGSKKEGKSFSRKFLKTRFWKNQRWKSFNELQIPADHTTTSSTTRADHNNSRDRWSGREINLQGHNYSDDESPGRKSCTGVECGEEANTKCPTSEDEDKEQFSPVSVLDCPFHQDDQETTSNFSQRLTGQLEGKANNLKKKLRRFEDISDQLMEPFELEKKMRLLSESPSATVDTTTTTMFIDMEKQVKAEDLLSGIMTQSTISSRNLLKLESNKKLLIDFFKEISNNNNNIINEGDDEAMKVAEDWANGNPSEAILDWQVREGRQAYIRDMEESGEWKMSKYNHEMMMIMTQQRVVGSEVESGVWSSLLDDLVSELSELDY